ncbi:MAG: potassium channel family protein [Planctomycetota bacterium]|jgi:trk system potassium uptake protein TrkA
MERFAVIGLGRFGRRLATLLAEAGADVIAVDRRQQLVDAVRHEVSVAVCMDSTDEDALRSQGVHNVDCAIVGIGENFESAALTTAVLKQLGVPRVICRATSDVRSRIFQRIGADEIVNPEREAAQRWRNRLVMPAILERTPLAEGTSMVQVAAPKSFAGKTLAELAIPRKYAVNVVGIRRPNQATADAPKGTAETMISVPMAESRVLPGDVLLLIGRDEDIAAFPT